MSEAVWYGNSLRASYRLTHALWIGCSALYLLVYLLLADLASDRTHGLFLALTILLPAIFVPLYIWRANFATRTEAVIRSVAPGLALSGVASTRPPRRMRMDVCKSDTSPWFCSCLAW